jgi:hypothetical protein
MMRAMLRAWMDWSAWVWDLPVGPGAPVLTEHEQELAEWDALLLSSPGDPCT